MSNVVKARLMAGIGGFAYDIGAGSQTAECHLGVLPGHHLAVAGDKDRVQVIADRHQLQNRLPNTPLHQKRGSRSAASRRLPEPDRGWPQCGSCPCQSRSWQGAAPSLPTHHASLFREQRRSYQCRPAAAGAIPLRRSRLTFANILVLLQVAAPSSPSRPEPTPGERGGLAHQNVGFADVFVRVDIARVDGEGPVVDTIAFAKSPSLRVV